MTDEVQNFDCLLDEIARIEARGGDRYTLDQVRRAMARFEAQRLYVRRNSLTGDACARLVDELLRSGMPRADVVRAAVERVGVSRRKAYYVIAAALDARTRRPC